MRIKCMDGFTFIELMVVIGIIGILIAIASPNFSASKNDFKLHTTARKCVMDMRYAQQLSMDTKDKHGIYFTQTGYTIRNFGTGTAIKTVNFEGGIIYTTDSLDGDTVVFGTDGVPCEADGETLFEVENKIEFTIGNSGLHIYINLTPHTGEVSSIWN